MLMEDADAKAGPPDRSARAVIDLLESWIEVDSRLDGGVEAWEQLKRAQLYDEIADPRELRNLAPDQAHSAIVTELRRLLQRTIRP